MTGKFAWKVVLKNAKKYQVLLVLHGAVAPNLSKCINRQQETLMEKTVNEAFQLLVVSY